MWDIGLRDLQICRSYLPILPQVRLHEPRHLFYLICNRSQDLSRFPLPSTRSNILRTLCNLEGTYPRSGLVTPHVVNP